MMEPTHEADWERIQTLLPEGFRELASEMGLIIPVGTALSGRPPDRAGRADFPHRAPTLGLRAREPSLEPFKGLRVKEARSREWEALLKLLVLR